MATESKTTDTLADRPRSSAIENELPAYRAISAMAVLSVICGAMAVLSIAHPFFYLLAALAVVAGYKAERNIQRYPDLLTGSTLAKAGIGMGLVFGLGIFTMTSVQSYLLRRNATSFARHYLETMKTGTIADLYWLGLPPEQRKSMTPNDVQEKMRTAKREEMTSFELKWGSLGHLKKRVDSSKDQELHFVEIEKESSEGVISIMLAVFEVHGPESAEFPKHEELALAFLKGYNANGKGIEWWVDDLIYPYKAGTAAVPEKAIDDGHGHAPGSH